MVDSIINWENPITAEVVIIGAPYDMTSSFGKGADLAPRAIRECLDSQIEFYDRVSNTVPVENLKIAYVELDDLADDSPEVMVQKVEEKYSLYNGKFRILLGGEHSVTNGPLSFFSSRSSSISIVQIDAHADLRDDDSDHSDSPSGKYAHCSVMKRAYDYGFQTVQIGVRAYSAAEKVLFDDPRITVFEWGVALPAISELIAAIPTKDVYLTLDVDGMDSACMPATGTPVPGGIDWHYCNEFIFQLFQDKNVVGADIVEVAPRPRDSITEYSAAQLCYSMIGCYFTK